MNWVSEIKTLKGEKLHSQYSEDVIIEHIQSSNTVPQQVSADQSNLENYILNNFSSTELTAEY